MATEVHEFPASLRRLGKLNFAKFEPTLYEVNRMRHNFIPSLGNGDEGALSEPISLSGPDVPVS